MIDGCGRRIDYVRISVTDRCNLRCTYCMAEDMTFLPRRDLLTLDEIAQLARHLVARGVRRIRLTGGEPLVRRGVMDLVRALGAMWSEGLEEVTLTTNGTLLARDARALFAAGVRRVNVSLDTLDPARFALITRGGRISDVIAGINAALAAGLTVKVNMVALKGVNDAELVDMVRWCGERGCDLSLIETMPLGEIGGGRRETFLPLSDARAVLEDAFALLPTTHRTAGPARYFEIAETGRRVGFITPLTDNFCAACNRIRISATGTVYACLGREERVELRDILRDGRFADLDRALFSLLADKPARHDFDIDRRKPAVSRHMSVTGG